MSELTFTKATKKKSKLRLALDGPSGSGKTYTALVAATAMAGGGTIAVIDTERGSASLYSDKFTFDVLELANFNPQHYIDAITAAEKAGYAVIVIDSLSHAWEGEGGALELVDQAAARSSGNSYVAWKNVTPLQRHMVDAMLQSPCHVIATMRSKMDYVQEKGDNGKTVIRKIGLAPVQRQGMEYEFTIVCDMDQDHNLIVSKTRCDLVDGAVVKKPTVEWFAKIGTWLNSGAAEVQAPKTENPPAQPKAPSSAPANGNGHAPIEYTGSLAKIGKNKYPAIWGQLLMANLKNLGGNAFEVDDILQKLGLPQETTPNKALEAVENYLAEKSGLAGIAPQ